MSRRAVLLEALGLWALAFAAIVLAVTTYPPVAKAVSVVAFLYLPLLAMRRERADVDAYGLTLRRWRDDVRLAALLFAVVGPLYVVGFRLVVLWTASHAEGGVPPGVLFRPQLPPDFWKYVVDQLFVTALPEEFFFRGWLAARLERVWPTGVRVLGVTVGPAFLATAALFALAHLAQPNLARLSVFFPALLFGWLRGRTGTIAGSTLFHAACNLLQMVLVASFSPAWGAR